MRLSPLLPGPSVKPSLLLMALGLVSCDVLPPAPPAGRIMAWRLVEVEAPGGKVLVLDWGGAGGSGSRRGVEVRLSRERAGVGEEVEAEIRLPGAMGRHWVEVHPGRAGVRILGPASWIVEGDAPVRARFTCDTPGPGGILALVGE